MYPAFELRPTLASLPGSPNARDRGHPSLGLGIIMGPGPPASFMLSSAFPQWGKVIKASTLAKAFACVPPLQ
jgi:hypothetical protein